jgi:hypothetical protein
MLRFGLQMRKRSSLKARAEANCRYACRVRGELVRDDGGDTKKPILGAC